MFTIAYIKELNNKSLLRIVCTLCDANKDNMPREKVKDNIMATLRAKFIGSRGFRKFQRERLNSLWKCGTLSDRLELSFIAKSKRGE